jgi:endonuclease/exonuclease/phosphatase family metal-dependent hydrolase
VARHRRIVGDRRVRVLTWNLFHGRDAPPEPGLERCRSRLLGEEAIGERYVQVGGSLRAPFAAVLAGERWHVALLQEAPPRWLAALCRASRASGALALTARNLGAPLRAGVAERRPDLLRSWEGGSNQLLVRDPWRIAAVHRLTLTRRPERRRLLLAALERAGGARLTVGCLHGSVSGRGPERDLARAASAAAAFAGERPLILGGDLNLRPEHSSGAFAVVRDEHGLTGATGPLAIDHLLARGLDVLEPPRELPPSRREVVRDDGRRVRLSDHAPVVACFGMR